MKSHSRSVFLFVCVTLVLVGLPALAQDYKFTIPTAQTWTDTGVDLHSGDTLAVTGSAGANGCDPSGVSGTGAAPGLPLSNAMPGALIARLQESGPALLVGPSQELRAESTRQARHRARVVSRSRCTSRHRAERSSNHRRPLQRPVMRSRKRLPHQQARPPHRLRVPRSLKALAAPATSKTSRAR